MKTILFMALALSACFCHKPKESSDKIVGEVNAFAFDFYSSIQNGAEGKDCFVSPVSASVALSLLTSGAEGKTADEIHKALGIKAGNREMNEFCLALCSKLLDADPETTIEIANSIWADKRISLKRNYVETSSKYYDASVRNVDFTNRETVVRINEWCSEKTHGCIESIVEELDPNTLLALINALYFKGEWSDKFRDAEDDRFRTIDGKRSAIKMMSRTDSYFYSEDSRFRMVEVPYGNGAFVMDFILPVEDEPEAFSQASGALDVKQWNSLVSALAPTEVRVQIPVFKMEYTADLIPVLQNMGINLAFTPKADFSGISDTPLMVSQVIQKAFVDVNEKGTEAAAVTFIGVKMTSAGPDRTIHFRADRPFLFAIRETSTGAILFLGQKVR